MTRRYARLMALAMVIPLAAGLTIGRMDAAQDTAQWWEASQTRAQVVGDTRGKGHSRTVLTNPTPLSDELYRAVVDTCATNGVPVALALGLIEVESGFDAEAVGPDGHDVGLFQLRDSNHQWLAEETGADPMTHVGNIECGVWLIGYLMDRYEVTDAALTAYRWGHDNGDRQYARAVQEAAEKWK